MNYLKISHQSSQRKVCVLLVSYKHRNRDTYSEKNLTFGCGIYISLDVEGDGIEEFRDKGWCKFENFLDEIIKPKKQLRPAY